MLILHKALSSISFVLNICHANCEGQNVAILHNTEHVHVMNYILYLSVTISFFLAKNTFFPFFLLPIPKRVLICSIIPHIVLFLPVIYHMMSYIAVLSPSHWCMQNKNKSFRIKVEARWSRALYICDNGSVSGTTQ